MRPWQDERTSPCVSSGLDREHEGFGACAQIYDQIYTDFYANKASIPFVATNYTSPILHNVELNQLKPQTT